MLHFSLPAAYLLNVTDGACTAMHCGVSQQLLIRGVWLCRQLGLTLYPIESALPLYDGATGEAISEETDARLERVRDALLDAARERVDTLGEDAVDGGAMPHRLNRSSCWLDVCRSLCCRLMPSMQHCIWQGACIISFEWPAVGAHRATICMLLAARNFTECAHQMHMVCCRGEPGRCFGCCLCCSDGQVRLQQSTVCACKQHAQACSQLACSGAPARQHSRGDSHRHCNGARATDS